MARTRKVFVVGGLAGSVLAAFVTLGTSAPAQAGAGTSQDVSSVLDLQLVVNSQRVTLCVPRGGGCQTHDTPPASFSGLAVSFGYTYTPGRVNSAPDVLSWSGRLPAELPPAIAACAGKLGVAIWVTDGQLTGSTTEFRKNGEPFPGPSSSASSETLPADGVAYCIDSGPVTVG